jgi:hypothetical protein
LKTTVVFLSGALCFAPWAAAQAAGVREAALARMPLARSIATDAQILKEIRAKNASGETMEEVQRKDKEWMQNPQFPLRKTLSENACAQKLRELIKGDANVVEAILMDKHGANVCVSSVTTDYWQGDEAKFQKTFDADKEVFVDEPAFDQSTGVFAIQLNVLIRDGQSKIGALTLTLRIKKQEIAK